MRKTTRPRIDSDQRCTCTRPLGSGRRYIGWEQCRLCAGFIVRSDSVRRRLEREAKRRWMAEIARDGGKGMGTDG